MNDKLKDLNYNDLTKSEGWSDEVLDDLDTEEYDIREDLPDFIKTLQLWRSGEIEGEPLTTQHLIDNNLSAVSYYMWLAQEHLKEVNRLKNQLEDENS